MKLCFTTLIFFFVASNCWLQAQDHTRAAEQILMEAIIQQRRASEACKSSNYIKANAEYEKAIELCLTAKKAFGRDKENIRKVNQRIDLITAEKEACVPSNRNYIMQEVGSRSTGLSGVIIQKAVGTGAIIGHISNVTISNSSPKPVKLCFSNKDDCPADALHMGMIYIADKKYQDYVVFGPPQFIIPANSTFVVPLRGVCVQPREDPVPESIVMTTPETWILERDTFESFSAEGMRNPKVVPTLRISNAKEVWPQIPLAPGMTFTLDSEKNAELTAALLFDAIHKIDLIIKGLGNDPTVSKTEFESKSENPDELLKLYSVWYYASILSGDAYTFEDFLTGISAQMGSQNLTTNEQNRLQTEMKTFWSKIVSITEKAAVLSSKLQN